MAEFRAVPAADRATLQRLWRYAFAAEDGPSESDAPVDDSHDESAELFDERGLFVDGSLVGACKLYELEARLRGNLVTLGGLGAVGVGPEHRGEGHASEVCRQALAEFREREVGPVALWPISVPLYRRLGWAIANEYVEFDCHPDALPDHDAEGRLTPLSADHWRRFRDVESSYGEGTSLSLHRSERWWRERTLADWDGSGEPYCYGYERDGEVRGYVVYTVSDDETRTLSVRDMAHVDEEAHRALLDFLAGHGAKIQRVLLRRAADADLRHRVDDPADVDSRLRTGPMVRLTDVTWLAEIGWPEAELDCTVAVHDPLLAHNDGRFRITVADGAASVRRLDEGSSEPDLTVGVGTLSQLAVGTHDVETVQRVGDLEVHDESIREPLAAVFRSRPVCLREFF